MTAIESQLVHMVSPAPSAAGRAPAMIRQTLTIAARELREAVRSRWFLLYTLGFCVLGLGVSYASAAATGGLGLSGFGRTTAGLVNLVLLVIPLMALNAGAVTIASERERGMLSYVLAQPVSRHEIVIGKFVGLAFALLASISLGFGGCATILAIKGASTSPMAFVWLTGQSVLLALAMLSVGVLISVLARKVSVAIGTAVFLWLCFVFVSDLGLMAGTVSLDLTIEQLLALSLANPLQVFKMWSLHTVEASLDVLGPAGLYAAEEYGPRLNVIFSACLLAWIVLPIAIASMVFARRPMS